MLTEPCQVYFRIGLMLARLIKMPRRAGCFLIAVVILERSLRAERPQGLASSSQLVLATDARGGLSNTSRSSERDADLYGKSATTGFEHELCPLLGPPPGRKLFWYPSKSVEISLHVACNTVHDTAHTSRVLTANFVEAHWGAEDKPQPVFGVQYWGYLVPGHTGLAGNATGWVLGASEGPGHIKAESFETLSTDVEPFFFDKAHFQNAPPNIFLAGTSWWSKVGNRKDMEQALGTKEQTLNVPLAVRNNAVSKKTRIWFSETPGKMGERGLLVLGLPVNLNLFSTGVPATTFAVASDAIGLEDASVRKTVHHAVSHGSRLMNGACPAGTPGIASCLNENYICTITKIERNMTTGKVSIRFKSTCDGAVSEGPLSQGKDPASSMLYWEDGEAKVTGHSYRQPNPRREISGRLTFNGVPKNINKVKFRYGRAGCSLDRRSSYSTVELTLSVQGAAGSCRYLLLALVCATAAATRVL